MASSHQSSLHALLLLSDSALPLGSFAFSSGLESFLAHTKDSNSAASQRLRAFEKFLEQSLRNIASTALPNVLTAYTHPDQLENLDNDFDASTPCTVARRASISQGKALLAIWERALATCITESSPASEAVAAFATTLKQPKPDAFGLTLNGHFPPLFGTVCAALGLSKEDTAYIFLLNHAKALLSAGVRASVLGPYQSQAFLASGRLQGWVVSSVQREKAVEVSNAAVTVPTMDLWMGRHELLYSRIFNS